MSQDMNRDDNYDVEQRLRAALRPVDPGAGFVGAAITSTCFKIESDSRRKRSTFACAQR